MTYCTTSKRFARFVRCDRCGRQPKTLHEPKALTARYCESCCPACQPLRPPLGSLRWAPVIDHDAAFEAVRE